MVPRLLDAFILSALAAMPCLSAGGPEPVNLGPYEIPGSEVCQAVLSAPEETVRGFPLILNVRLTNVVSTSTCRSVLDLARGGMADRLEFFFWDGGEQAYIIRREEPSFPGLGAGTPAAHLEPGESASMWFDLVNVMYRRGGGQFFSRCPDGRDCPWAESARMLQPGAWQLVFRWWSARWTAGPVRLAVRDPNEEERDFLNLVEQMEVLDSRAPSWFPDLVVTPKALPVSDGLPTSTRRIVELVELLRAAVRSEDDALQTLSAKVGFDWGYLRDFVEQIRYECLLSMPNASKAQELEGALNWPDRERIQRGGGIVAQLRVTRDRDAYK